MSTGMIPSGDGGGDANLSVTLSTNQALSSLNTLQARIFAFGNNSQNAFNKANGTMGRFTKTIGSINNSLKGLIGTIGSFVAVRAGMQALGGFIHRLVEVNRSFMGFTASMKVIKGSLRGAADEYEFLLAMSNKLGVSVEDAISHYHRLAAALKNVDKSGELTRHVFSGISQAAVVLHSKGRDVHLIFEAVQQMASKGKLSLEELQRQLGNTMPGAFSIAARAMMKSQEYIAAGISTASEAERKLRDDIQKGYVNVYEFIARFSDQLKTEYGSGVEYASKQITATINRMKNAMYEFHRVVGSSDAMAGLVELTREITALFNDDARRGAEGLGKAFGDIFRNIAEWVKNISSQDIKEFFAVINTSVASTIIVTDEFFKVFSRFDSPEIHTPLLDFVQFVATAMANLVDVIRLAITQVLIQFNHLSAMWASTQRNLSGGSIVHAGTLAIDKMADSVGIDAGKGNRAATRRRLSDLRSLQDHNNREIISLTEEFDAITRGRGATGRVTTAFNDARSSLIANKYGVEGHGVDVNIPGYAGNVNTYTQGKPMFKEGISKVPDYITQGNRGKAGSTADAAAAYVNPLGDYKLQQLIDNLKENSGSPNVAKDGKGKGKKGGKTLEDRAETLFLKEQTRLLKDLSVAQNEYQNILDNKNLSEGKNVAQMRSLIATDERYVALTSDKKSKLMEWAKSLDDMELRIINATKAQEAWNNALVEGYDAESRMQELARSGFENQFREEVNTRNSFKKGGENELADQLTQQKLLAAAIKQDTDARNLSMAQYSASIRQSNEEMLFQADLIGLTALEAQKLIEFRKIDLWIQQQMSGAPLEMQQHYLRLAEILKTDVASALDEVAKKQYNVLDGIKAAMAAYIDQYGNMARNMGEVTANSITGLEDAFVSFVETGKLSFKELAQSIAKDLVRLIARYLIVMMLQRMTGLAPGGGASVGNIGNLTTVMGGVGPRYAKGGVFSGGKELQFFAKGAVISGTTMFPMKNGTGVMSEKSPEAIMPLARDSSGSLGVKAIGGNSGGGDSYLNLTVEVYQGEGKGIRTEKSQNEKGDVLKILIGEVASDIQRGGQVHKAITTTYGMSRKPKVFS